MISLFNAFLNKTNAYRFNNRWDIAAPLEQSWNELLNYRGWPAWCDALEKIEPVGQFHHLKKGNQIRSVWKGTLPYRLRVDVIIGEIDPFSFLSFNVTGDLRGEGRCHFLGSEGNTTINFNWDVAPTKLWMRMSSPFARPIFIENHNHLIQNAVAGFIRMIQHKNGFEI